MTTFINKLRHYFLQLQNTDVKDLERFYNENYAEYRLDDRQNNVKLNGSIITEDKRREIIVANKMKSIYRDAPSPLSDDDILEDDETPYSEKGYIKNMLLTLQDTDNIVMTLKLTNKVEAYKGYLQLRKDQLETKRADYIIDTDIISTLYKTFNTDQEPIWLNVEYKNFLACFDIANTPLVTLSYNKQAYMVYILNKIDRVTNEIPLSHFGIPLKSYRTQKSRIKTGTANLPFKIQKGIDSIFKKIEK